MDPAMVHPIAVRAAHPSPTAVDRYPMGLRGIGRASRCRLDSRVAASRGCRVRGSCRLDRPVRGSRLGDRLDRRVPGSRLGDRLDRRVPGSRLGDRLDRRVPGSRLGDRLDRPVPGSRLGDRLDRPVRGSRPAAALPDRVAAEVHQDRRGHIGPLAPACKGAPRRRHLTVVRCWPHLTRSRSRLPRPLV
jgi:hypothetical protein